MTKLSVSATRCCLIHSRTRSFCPWDFVPEISLEISSRAPWKLSWMWSSPAAMRAESFVSSRSEEHTSELQSPCNLVCRLLLEQKKNHETNRNIIARRTWRAAHGHTVLDGINPTNMPNITTLPSIVTRQRSRNRQRLQSNPSAE